MASLVLLATLGLLSEPERARGGTGGARTSWSATKDSSPGVSPPAGLSRTAACCSSHSIASSVCNSARQVRETTSQKTQRKNRYLIPAEPQRLAALVLREAHVLQRGDRGLRRRAGRRVRHFHSCLR